MHEIGIDEAYVNGHNNAIEEIMEVVQAWQELRTVEFYLDSKNNAWVSLLSLARLADESKESKE